MSKNTGVSTWHSGLPTGIFLHPTYDYLRECIHMWSLTPWTPHTTLTQNPSPDTDNPAFKFTSPRPCINNDESNRTMNLSRTGTCKAPLQDPWLSRHYEMYLHLVNKSWLQCHIHHSRILQASSQGFFLAGTTHQDGTLTPFLHCQTCLVNTSSQNTSLKILNTRYCQ